MYRRILSPALLSGLLLFTVPGAVRPSSEGEPNSPVVGVPDPLAQSHVVPHGEQRLIEALNAPGISPEAITLWIGQLGQFGRSPATVAELIRWLEFSPVYYRAFNANSETVAPYLPAERWLIAIGSTAAPQLVDEYVYFFENTRATAWKGRYAALAGDPKNGVKPNEVQNPSYRLSTLAVVLSCDRPMAQKAVAYARQRMAKDPWNPHNHRACQELIGRIIAQFPLDEREKLFPAVDLAE